MYTDYIAEKKISENSLPICRIKYFTQREIHFECKS